jgi:hypothetical protein
MDVLVFLVSQASMKSEWVLLEVKHAITRELTEKRALLLPFIIDGTEPAGLPWFLRHKTASRVSRDAAGAAFIAGAVRTALERRAPAGLAGPPSGAEFRRDPRVEKLIAPVRLGDWNAAREAALEMVGETGEFGQNELFDALLKYQDLPDDEDLRWGAIITIESFLQLAPWLVDRPLLNHMANHSDFSVRSSAASICMDLANSAPDRVPVDILLRLARHDEDWYVMAPATAALKTMARCRPAVLHAFIVRLRSQDPGARQHAAEAIGEIARKEPEILDADQLRSELSLLKRIGDEEAAAYIAEAASKAANAEHVSPYKYGI